MTPEENARIELEKARMRLFASGLQKNGQLPHEVGIVKKIASKDGPDWWHNADTLYLAAWWQRMFEKPVGPRNWHIRLRNLKPSDESSMPTAIQEKCIAMLKERPDDSYLMLGPAGCSKTTYAVALFGAKLLQRPQQYSAPIWYCEVKPLLDKFVAYANGEGDVPKPNVKLIEALYAEGKRPTLVLEEMDKLRLTDYKLGELFDLINAIYKYNGQIIVTSNMTKEEFIAAFDAPIFRRLTEMKSDGTDERFTSHFWDFYKYRESQ